MLLYDYKWHETDNAWMPWSHFIQEDTENITEDIKDVLIPTVDVERTIWQLSILVKVRY